ncbi:MAG: GDSL-type esterase/lipase family protein [Peptoniphilus sp.]|nr:GDSL-type esterase/lipase family protein [Peptoniphilus sp.]MDD7363844.1 GDSL-type esterase/lipase family protein [Bacillota bacterium]MDY6044317.1 GDSL-type esterase/lipase family protein [Peptoniphilus sp.]
MTNIVAVGDSYVAGYGVDADASWVARLEEKLDRPIVNLGENGAWITELSKRAYPLEAGDVLLVLGGCNDLLGDASVDRVLEAYDAFRDMADARGARCMILLPPMPDIVGDELFVGMLMIESLKEKMKELYRRADGYPLDCAIRRDKPMFLDGIHLIEEGHAQVAEAVYRWGMRDGIFLNIVDATP